MSSQYVTHYYCKESLLAVQTANCIRIILKSALLIDT